ncbi:ArnT family glycosyltransferase [Candidatus Altiarchaeota archaeon]
MKYVGNKVFYCILALVFLLALALRLPNLYVIPHWDWDEGVNMNYAWNLAQGRLQWFTLKYSFIPHPPGYLVLLALVVKIVGQSLFAARILSVSLFMISMLFLYLVGVEVADRRIGLLSALLYAIYPAAIYWSRTGMINNLSSLLIISSLYFFIKHVKDGGSWWLPASLSLAGACLTSYIPLSLMPMILLYFLVKEKKNFWKVSLVLMGPLAAFFIVMYLLRGDFFLSDFMYQLERFHLLGFKTVVLGILLLLFTIYFKKLKPFLTNLLTYEVEVIFGSRHYFNEVFVPSCLLAMNFMVSYTLLTPFSDKSIFTGGDYFWFGIIGLLFIERLTIHVVILYFMPIFMFTIVIGRSDHMLIHLYPFFSLGSAILLDRLRYFMVRIFNGYNVKRAFALSVTILAIPFLFTIYYDAIGFMGGRLLAKEDLSSALDAASYVNSVTDPNDFVLTTSNLNPFMASDASIITQAFVYEGRSIGYYRPNLTPDWFTRNCSYQNADYIVVPPGALKWFKELGHDDLADQMLGWRVVYSNKVYAVYINPLLDDESAPED